METEHIEEKTKDSISAFIEDAIAGGWKPFKIDFLLGGIRYEDDEVIFDTKFSSNPDEFPEERYKAYSTILLDPEAWKAVERYYDKTASSDIIHARAKDSAITFISKLHDGFSINSALDHFYGIKTIEGDNSL